MARPDTVERRGERIDRQVEEALGEEEPESADAEALSLALVRLAERPVNVNTADLWGLLQVPGMNLRLAQSLLDYRARSKPFETVSELRRVPGIGPATLESFRPYVTVGGRTELRRMLFRDARYWTAGAEVEHITRLRRTAPAREGHRRPPQEGGYAGSPLHLYHRFRFTGDHLSASLLGEKDAGEALRNAGDYDYRSWHLAVRDAGRLKALVAGDYTLSFGQGLVMWGGGIFGKGAEVISAPVRGGSGIRPHSSASEGTALRGAAATVGERLQLTAFWSDRRLSAARLGADSTGPPRSAGYHRTLSELRDRERLRQSLEGGRLQLRTGRGVLGVTSYRGRFHSYVHPGDAPWRREEFGGRRFSAAGIDFALAAGPVMLFGEAARSANGRAGVVGGIEGELDERTRVTALYRSYHRRFHSLRGSGFGERSGPPRNEEGFYLGFRHRPAPEVDLRGYVDIFRFPGPRFGVARPSTGHEWLALLKWEFAPGAEAYLQARGQRKEEEYLSFDPAGREIRLLGEALRETWRLHLRYAVTPRLRSRTRLEISRGHPAGRAAAGAGYLLYQDLRLRLGPRLTVDARLTYFDTPSWETRIYQFENNLLHLLSNELLYGRGQRVYLLLHLRPWDFLDLWMRVGSTAYRGRTALGSGMAAIPGKRKRDLGFQLRLKF